MYAAHGPAGTSLSLTLMAGSCSEGPGEVVGGLARSLFWLAFERRAKDRGNLRQLPVLPASRRAEGLVLGCFYSRS